MSSTEITMNLLGCDMNMNRKEVCVCIIERERAKEAQTAIGQREQNFILVSPVLKDKIREGREIF